MKKKEWNLTAFVVGGTGAVGKDLIKALTADPRFTKVTLISRREAIIPPLTENKNYEKFVQQIIDFDNLDEYKDVFKGHDVGFSCLGTPWGRNWKENFYKVDHDYVVNTAKLAKEGGTRHFHLVSAADASKNSMLYYNRVKAEVEEEMSNLGFESLSIYRPGFLLPVKREVTRVLETMIVMFFKALDRWRWYSMETELLGKAIVVNTFTSGNGKEVEILENEDIIRVGQSQFKE